MSPQNRRRQRVRIRRRVLTVQVVMPGTEPPKRRTNPYGYQFANEARARLGRRKAERMARRWAQAGYVFPGKRAAVVATLFGTTRAAVYQRMYRYRRGLYSLNRPPRSKPGPLRIEYVYSTPDSARCADTHDC
jgi:hypothetical protein